MNKTISQSVVGAFVLAAFGYRSLCAPFSDPTPITGTEANYRMSRCANNQMDFDSEGNLHVTYWSGRISTLPSTPSYIYHRSWNLQQGWSAQVSVDDSTAEGSHLGGRHPSLAVDTRDSVWIVWHDHRHSTSSGNWIDNLEIYADVKPEGGSFSGVDLRITTTANGHLGDSGYTPRVVAHQDGRVSISWYDFGLDGNIADLFLKISDPSGILDLGENLQQMRITDKDDRGGVGSFSVPDMAVDSDGVHHLCWVSGLGAGADLYYGQALAGGSPTNEVLLKSQATDFFDPAHITVSPEGDVWIAYGDDEVNGIGSEDVAIFRRRAGQPNFDPPVPVVSDTAREYDPDIEIDSEGIVHLVWVDEREGTHIYHATFEPEDLTLISEDKITERDGNWARPSLALDSHDQVCILWEEEVGFNSGAIWFATNATEIVDEEPRSSNENWLRYE